MRIEIWSDVVCPWCYIGKRRLEKALADFPHAAEVEITWRSFQLDPDAPTVSRETTAEAIGRKYGGGPEAGLRMMDQVRAVAAEEGMLLRLTETQRVNTVDAHRVLHLALANGGPTLQGALKERLLAAYFLQARNVADHDTLLELAVETGLAAAEVRDLLAGDDFRDAVEEDTARAHAYGASGVPFFVVDERFGASGAQSSEAFTQLLERAWTESHPAVTMVDTDGEACGPDGCAV